MNTPSQYVKVWDPIVRIGHWTLVIAFFTAYLTEDEFMTQHIWAGYVVAGVVLFRIFWGIIGSTHARFSDFIYSPSTVFAYLKSLLQRNPKHYLGHNPAGGAMVIALLISLCVTVYSGLALYAVEENAGPFTGIYGQQAAINPSTAGTQLSLISTVQAKENESEEEERAEKANAEMKNAETNQKSLGNEATAAKTGEVNEQDEEFWEGIHEFFANFTLFLVAVHICGVLISSHLEKVNLIKAMITGRKKSP
jgi:cytochrome b